MNYLLRLLLVVTVALAWSGEASAQIYSFRDANGNLVLQDQPPRDQVNEVATFAVPRASTVRTTRPGPASYPPRFDRIIDQHASRNKVRADLVRAVIQVESGYDPRAVSAKGALGLMQLMPQTARELGVRNPFDPEENIRGGTSYLRQLLERFDQDEELALAAYNAGPQAVVRYGQRVPPYRETRNYVRKVRNGTEVEAVRARRFIYKIVELIDGRPVPRYTNRRPESGAFEIVPLTR